MPKSSLNATLQNQLKDALMNRIRKGDWQAGTLIPSERKLCEEFNISRITVREALKDLVQEGYLVRRQGKGTFVAQPSLEQTVISYYSTAKEIAEKRLQSKFYTLSFGRHQVPVFIQKRLNLQTPDSTYALVRLRFIGDRIFAWERAVIPDDLLEGATEEELNKDGLYLTILHHSGLLAEEAEEYSEAVNCPDDVAVQMMLPKGTAVMHVLRWTKAQGRLIEFCESYFHGEMYKYKHILAKAGTA